MAEINPPFALQNAGATHTAAGDRLTIGALLSGSTTLLGLTSRGGIHPTAGDCLDVDPTGSPSMQVVVSPGIVFVAGTEGATQGTYVCVNDANKNLTVTTAHGTLPRIDRVVARVYDSAYSGVTNTWALEIVTGTAASSPVPPTLPANSFPLFSINVGAAVTSITNGNIADARTYIAAVGGVIPVNSQAERDSLLSLTGDGQLVFRKDTGVLEARHSGVWVPRSPQRPLKQDQVSSPAFTINGVFNDFPGANWPAITFTAPPSGIFTVSIGAQLGADATHSTWAGYRISGGLVVGPTGATAIGIMAPVGAFSKEWTFDGAPAGSSITVTPMYQIQSGSGSASISVGQLRVRLES